MYLALFNGLRIWYAASRIVCRLLVSWFPSSAADSSLVDKVGVIRERLTNFRVTDSGALSVVPETGAECDPDKGVTRQLKPRQIWCPLCPFPSMAPVSGDQ